MGRDIGMIEQLERAAGQGFKRHHRARNHDVR
jgi:hypothetical protein